MNARDWEVSTVDLDVFRTLEGGAEVEVLDVGCDEVAAFGYDGIEKDLNCRRLGRPCRDVASIVATISSVSASNSSYWYAAFDF